MQRYTVKQLARLSGVSVRTLHHYDDIGLLKPARVSANRYRHYTRAELLRLQQILFHRELGFSLQQIGRLLDAPGFDVRAALAAQRERLVGEAQRYARLVQTIDRTIADLNGQHTMKTTELFDGFSPERQAGYERWLIERYSGEMASSIQDSRQKLATLPQADKTRLQAELTAIEEDLAEACRRQVPSDSPVLEGPLQRHREWVGALWNRPCSPQAYGGLADLYLAHPDFRARYEALAPGFTEYLAGAMKAYAGRVVG